MEPELSFLKPLDGSPLISDNCWNTVLDSLRERISSESNIRVLEWGSGNSTISFVREGAKADKDFELISVDHDTRFFPYLAESEIQEFINKRNVSNTKDVKIFWQAGVENSKISSIGLLKRNRLLKSSVINWQIISGNKRIQYAERFKPSFNLFRLGVLKNIVKLILITLGYLNWILFRNIKNSKGSVLDFTEDYSQSKHNSFTDFFLKNPQTGFLKIEGSGINVSLWHIPELRTLFWRGGVLHDCSINQLPQYVNVPLSGKFDLVFVDGRSRVSCAKRVFHDSLLKDKAYLFVHDAYRTEMFEAFNLFSPTATFVHGSNVTLNGSTRCKEDFGFPLVKTGDSIGNIDFRIAQELFIFRNQHESS